MSCPAVVNAIGCERVLDNLPTSFSSAFAKAEVNNFTSSDGEVAGWTKSAGKGAGNVAFVSFRNAGHMVRLALRMASNRADAWIGAARRSRGGVDHVFAVVEE